MFAGTFTVKVAVDIAPTLSVTVRVKVELVAVQLATTLAVTLPEPSMLGEPTVTPVPVTGVTDTIRVFGAWSGSLTVAICETDAAVPCWRDMVAPVIEGEVLTVSMKVASVVTLQLSVALIVIVCVPKGAALLIDTTPVELLTEIVPVYVP